MSFMRYVNIFLDLILQSQKVFDRTLKLLGPLFVVLATGITTFIIFTYFTAILPYYFGPISNWGFLAYFHFMLSLWVSFSIYYNYFLSALTSPGNTPSSYKQQNGTSNDENFVGHCRKCDMPKPERAHHCSVCKKYVFPQKLFFFLELIYLY